MFYPQRERNDPQRSLALELRSLPNQSTVLWQQLSPDLARNMKRSSRACNTNWIEHYEMMSVRRQTVEHPLGTLKHRMGSAHFLTRMLPRVRAKMSLHMLAFNLKRLMQILRTAG